MPILPEPGCAARGICFQAADRSYLVSASRIHSGHNDELRTIHVVKDISDRREAERRYRRERDFNKNILNNTQSMILVLDTAGLISYANRRCFEAGYRETDLLGHSLTDIISPARRPVLKETLERALHGAAVDNSKCRWCAATELRGNFRSA